MILPCLLNCEAKPEHQVKRNFNILYLERMYFHYMFSTAFSYFITRQMEWKLNFERKRSTWFNANIHAATLLLLILPAAPPPSNLSPRWRNSLYISSKAVSVAPSHIVGRLHDVKRDNPEAAAFCWIQRSCWKYTCAAVPGHSSRSL